MRNNFYARAFWLMVSFVLGNVLSFAVFGIHTVSMDQFEKATAAITGRQDAQDAHMQSIDTHIANLSGQLTGKHLLSNP